MPVPARTRLVRRLRGPYFFSHSSSSARKSVGVLTEVRGPGDDDRIGSERVDQQELRVDEHHVGVQLEMLVDVSSPLVQRRPEEGAPRLVDVVEPIELDERLLALLLRHIAALEQNEREVAVLRVVLQRLLEQALVPSMNRRIASSRSRLNQSCASSRRKGRSIVSGRRFPNLRS